MIPNTVNTWLLLIVKTSLLLLQIWIAHAQSSFHINEGALLFEDAKTKEPVLVYNDSMAASGFDFNKHFKIDFPEDLKLSGFNEYKYQIGDVNYFVHNGGGIILKYTNNTFTRIDNSFKHKNQYGATHFQKDSALYLLGGYGFFEMKRLLTRFDFKRKEWFRVQTKNESIVPAGKNWSSILNEDYLYVFSPFVENKNNFLKRTLDENGMWRLNLSTFEWKQINNHQLNNIFNKKDILPRRFKNFNVQINNRLVIFSSRIIEVSADQDQIKVYSQNYPLASRQLIYHKKNDFISILYSDSSNALNIISLPYENVKGDLIFTSELFKKSHKEFHLFWIAVAVFILSVFFLRFKVIIKRIKTLSIREPKIIYNSQDDSFCYGKKELENIGTFKKEILKAFIKSNGQYILLNSINDVIRTNGVDENFYTIKKRREMLLKELKNELGVLTGKSPEQILNIKRNEFDKRIKEIKLNLQIITK